jgi:putative redox protein
VVDIDVVYRGELRCQAVHRPSGTELVSDAPLDNQGRAESFSPTDLVATALGTCMLTIMGMRARRFGWNIEGTQVHVHKAMSTEGPRRIARLRTRLSVSNSAALDAEARRLLEDAANTCPVRLSIHPDIDVPIEFEWL